MKIAIITPTLPPYAGGIGNVAASNALELAKLGHDVTIFTPQYNKAKDFKEELTELKIKRIKPLLKYGNAAFVPALHWMLKDFNIIHLHYPFFGGAETIWFYKRKFKKRGAKIVLHYHMDVVGEGLFKLIFKIHKILLLPRIVKMVDKVIFTSMDYGKNSDLAKLAAKEPNKFIEVPNGVDTSNFQPQDKSQTLMSKHEIKPEDKVVLFVGGLDKAHYFKGIEGLIEAMSRLRDTTYSWKLVIVGSGELKEEYFNLASQFKMEFKTVFTGYVSNEDLPKYYNLANVVVLPSIDKSEAFGLALVEGMACGKPVIASDLVGVRSVVTQDVNGLLVKPKDVEGLADKINYLLTDTDEALQFGKAGRRKVKAKYDWKIIGEQLDEIYNGLNPKTKITNSK
ncbi:MAG: hypothetical protein CMI53_03185 [Parcubacteria group bacterium]|jgi:glycosyltransferase involved in cell wall biosynthesis|nr:hypothetical protein [Parcubacteria group bacterium]|tara:strand:+ start:2998 stop:4185 length:1188 start_codon:yes stop_codon:yes gene_type:complete